MASKKSRARFSILSELHENVPTGWDAVATRLCMETLPMSAREADETSAAPAADLWSSAGFRRDEDEKTYNCFITFAAALTVCSMSVSLCAVEINPASNCELPGLFHKIYALKVQFKKVLV